MEEESRINRLKTLINRCFLGISLKIIIFSYGGAIITLLPFLVLQMKSMGLTFKEIALLYLILPITSITGPLVSGLIADKTGKYKLIFICNMILASIFYDCLLLIPHKPKLNINFSCENELLSLNESESCLNCIELYRKQNVSNGVFEISNCQQIYAPKKPLDVLCSENKCPSNYIDNMSKVEFSIPFSSTNHSSTCSSDLLLIEAISTDNRTIELQNSCNSHVSCDLESITPVPCFQESAVSLTTVLTFLAMFSANFFIASAFTMVDAITLQYIKKHQMEIGKQKIMTMLGYGICPLLAGFILDYNENVTGIRSYAPTFYLSNSLMFAACMATFILTLEIKTKQDDIFKGLGRLIASPEIGIFMIVVLFLGCNFGFIEGYLFLFLRSLDAPNVLLGLTMTVGCISSIPILFCADWIQKKIGRHWIFIGCFTLYAVRLLGYSFMTNPWMCLIFESLESITYQLMWVTCLSLCPILAPQGLLATMTGVTGTFHYSFGRGIGTFAGGQIISAIGMRKAFRAYSGIALTGGIFYTIIHFAYLRKKIEVKEKEHKEKEVNEENKEFGSHLMQRASLHRCSIVSIT